MRNLEKEWITQAGLTAYVVTTEMGHRCGYVALPEGHNYHGFDYDTIPVECHGGLTYSKKSELNTDWIIGFDCGHYMDAKDPALMSEKYREFYRKHPPVFNDGVVRTLEYCIAECESIAKQVALEKLKEKEK